MTNKKGIKNHKIKNFYNTVKNGLLLFYLTHYLKRMGIEIIPYYWEKEYVVPCAPPLIKGNSSEYSIKIFSKEELKIIYPKRYRANYEKTKNGRLWIGIMHNHNIAAHTQIELNKLIFERENSIKFSEDEAYLMGMYTMKPYRGRNLAPYLRYHVYQILEEMGRFNIYSITDYFNLSSLKFKKKLNSEHIKLHLYINLFKKYQWNFILKRYVR